MSRKSFLTIIVFIIYLIEIIESQATGKFDDAAAKIIEYEYTPNESGYHFRFKTTNGIERTEDGIFKLKNGIPVLTVVGKSQYIGRDDKNYYLEYTADENGYRAKTSHNDNADYSPAVGPRISTTIIHTLTGGNNG